MPTSPVEPTERSEAAASPRAAVANAASDRLPLRAEVQRKAIHFCSAAVPLLVWFLPKGVSIAVLALGAAAALAIEWARYALPSAQASFLRWTGPLLRARERDGVSGATYMAIGYLVAVVIFPRPVAVVAMLYNALGDGVAAIAGKRWGRRRIRNGKSLEGAAAGFVTNLVIGIVAPGIPLVAAAIGGGTAALLELLPIPLDDNLSVTLGGGIGLMFAIGLA